MLLNMKFKFFYIIFIAIIFGNALAMDLRPLSEINKDRKLSDLTSKESTLVMECANKLFIKDVINFEIKYKPKVDNIFSDFSIQNIWTPLYEKSEVVVIFKVFNQNRFGEKNTKELICGWAGVNYDLILLKQ